MQDGDQFQPDVNDLDQAGEHVLAQAASAKVRVHGDRGHVGLVDHQPEASKAHDRGQIGRRNGGCGSSRQKRERE